MNQDRDISPPALFPPLLIQVTGEVVRSDRAFEAVWRNLDFREPQNRIQDHFAVVIIAPILMMVATRPAKV